MLRDFKIMRRNPGNNHSDVDEIENVPLNPNLSNHSDHEQLPKNPRNASDHEQETGNASKAKFERTPVKSTKSKTIETPLRTPDRQGYGGRKRFGYTSMSECRDDFTPSLIQPTTTTTTRPLNLTPRVTAASAKTHSDTTTTTSSAQTTPTKSVSKPPHPAYAPYTASRYPSLHGTARAPALSRRFSVAGPQPCAFTTAEVPHFDLKENPSFWMDHNVQVIIRVRPLNTIERNTNGYNRCIKQDSAQSITWIGQPETRFTFDHVACETVDQEMLFRMAGLPMVENCLSGYNSCMFAYGQTGSGKTYTMLGEMEDVEFTPSTHRGMTPRIFEFLFARIRAEEESRSDEKLKYNCRCSFLEIYNEQITDLLDPSSTNLLLREDVQNGVYVENLSEFEVHTVGDVLRLLIQGSSNRKVAATNMNRESSRSHSVFTCIIESKWERDSTTNLRYARLNLVDLAGSERQKSSGAEGERLKEAANINKSLSTLGHVIMLLVDIAHGKPRHVPYRDSRLTFLLQDSLGGNSKTMIIANISPSVCCAAETLNTLKFAQRAKLIQNNAVVNEDSSGDVAMLQRQICLLKEELSALKNQNLSRALGFYPLRDQDNIDVENRIESDQPNAEESLKCESKESLQVSSKQLKSLKSMLTGALRREQMTESSIKKLEAEIEQLNRLVRQREEDSRCTKMMLKFREDKIQRMESLVSGLKPVDVYLLEENAALTEEIQLLRTKVDRNPEVTRFAVENIRLLEQLRRFQDFYEDGERDILLEEVSQLRAQLICSLEESSQQKINADMVQDAPKNNKETESIHSELSCTLNELADCQSKLKACLETNENLSREIEDLRALLRTKESEKPDHLSDYNSKKEVQAPCLGSQLFDAVDENGRSIHCNPGTHDEQVVNLELELDILKIILKEERFLRGKMDDTVSSLTRDVQLGEERVMSMRKQWEASERDLSEAKSVIEALESQQLLSISEIKDLKTHNRHYVKLLRQQELQTTALKEQRPVQEPTLSSLNHSEAEDSPLQLQLKRMQASLDKAKRLNVWYQSDHASQRTTEEEMDEVRRQAEAETAEVIVCLQEELSVLQQRVQENDLREKESESRMLLFETKVKELQETSDTMSHENEVLRQSLLEKNMEIKLLVEEWELLSCEIEESLIEGHDALRSASDQLASISLSDRRGWISEQFGKMIRHISDKESVIEKLNLCLEDANTRVNDMERMLLSLRGATMVMTESHQQECYEKEKEIQQLRAELATHLHSKEEEFHISVKKGCETKESLEAEVLSLLAAFTDFQKICESKIQVLDCKLHDVEGGAQNAKRSWQQTKESLEFQLVEAKATTAHNMVEASGLLDKFEEAQDTMKEADVMINGLMIANESLKFEVEDLKNINLMLTSQRDSLINEVQGLLSANEINNQTCRNLEKQLELDMSQNLSLIEELWRLVGQVQSTSEEAFTSLTHEFDCLKSQLHETVEFMHSSLENIWSQIFVKDCAMSVLHYSHMGGLLETVASLNAENGLLHNRICESNAVIYDLKEHYMKSNEELELCRMLKVKLLTDFKNNFDCVSRKEIETRELNSKLDHFNEKLLVLQHQEELMLERSNFMSSELCSLSSLMKEMGHSNSQMIASLSEEEENFTVEWYAKDLELLVLASKLQELADDNADREREQTDFQTSLDYLLRELVTLQIIADVNAQIIFERENEVICMQKRINEAELGEAKLLTQLQALEAEHKTLSQKLRMKENDLDKMQNGMSSLQFLSKDLQQQLLVLERENASLQHELQDQKSDNIILLKDIQDKNSEFKSSMSAIETLKLENCRLQESRSVLESRIAILENDMEVKKAELNDFQCVQSSTAQTLCNKSQDLESYAFKVNALQEENLILKDEVRFLVQSNFEMLSSSNATAETAELQSCRMVKQLEEKILMVLDQMSEDSGQNLDVVLRFSKELELIDLTTKDLISQNLTLEEELLRKDEVLNGLLFDLRLLQESVANSKDQKDKMEELAVTLETAESELAIRLQELNEAVAYGHTLEAEVQRQGETVSALEMELEKSNMSVNNLSDENLGLKSQVEENMATRSYLEKELSEKTRIIDNLENELLEMGNTLGRVNDMVADLNSNLNEVKNQKDQFQRELQIMEEKVETARALAEENEAVAAEAQEIAESRRFYAEEKEEEVELLERSVQELDSTISVLENKVDVLKGEAEKQRLQREELEMELQSLKTQMLNVENADADVKRHFDEKSKKLQEALTQIQYLEKEVKDKDTEISKCKGHIYELTLQAEAQACEYKHKFKELEAMVEQFKSEEASSHEKISASNKLEKNASKGRGSASPFKAKGSGSPFKPRGSGSPFKCIGLGFVNHVKSEKDEEFNAERLRIEELETLAASRQKEIFILNARLAAAESMTHDVIRDLLGVKLDMSSYATLLDKQEVQKITEKAQLHSVELQGQEVNQLKKQLNEFIEERQGWLEEMEKKRGELVAAQNELEKFRRQEKFLTSENEDLKVEMQTHRKRVTELEGELKKLSGQQNLHQRIHHHAKIKEENNVLKVQNEDLCHKLRRAESFLVRAKEELAHYRACNGRSPYTNFDEEQRLKNKLKETEQEKLHLAQTLLGLCTSILKAAGITKRTSEVDLSTAEEALQSLVARLTSLERELEDLKLKDKMTNERMRLAELKPESSPYSSRSGDNRQTPRRVSQSPFFSALDR